MRFKIHFILVLVSGLVFSQKPHVVEFDKAKLINSIPFDVIEWVDLRSDKSYIGWAQKGMSNRKVPAILNEPIERVLESFLPPAGRKKKVAVRFRQLFVDELTKATKEFGFANVSMELFLVQNNTYNYLETISYTSRCKGADVTKKHGQNILDAIKGALLLASDSLTSYITLSEKEWSSNIIIQHNTENLAILNESPKEGVFVTLREFLENKPQKMPIELEVKKQFVKVKTIENGSSKELTYGFAVAKEGKIYIRFQEAFQELSVENGSFVFDGPNRVDANKVSNAAIWGGMIGAGIASAATKEKWKYRLDLSTGEKVPIKKL